MATESDDLTTDEGLNEGSAETLGEDEGTAGGAGEAGALAAASTDDEPAGEYDPSPPLDTESHESRAAREATGDGQQLEAGEG